MVGEMRSSIKCRVWVCSPGICAAEVVAFNAVLRAGDEETFRMINGIQLAAGRGTLLLVRLCDDGHSRMSSSHRIEIGRAHV